MTKTTVRSVDVGSKKPKPKPASISELQAQERLINQLELRLDAAKGEAKLVKDLLDSAHNDLRRMVRGDAPELFDEETGEIQP